LACTDAELLFKTADVTGAMSAEALLGTDRTFQAQLQEVRPHAGQIASAYNLARLMNGSQIVGSHRHSQHAVQDSYSVRCSPQVAGAARDTLDFARRTAVVELGSTIDNPIVMENGDVESTGNFPGERRLGPDVGHAGGPRFDGVGRGSQAAHRPRQRRPHTRRRALRRGSRAGTAPPARTIARDQRRAPCAAQARRRSRARSYRRAG